MHTVCKCASVSECACMCGYVSVCGAAPRGTPGSHREAAAQLSEGVYPMNGGAQGRRWLRMLGPGEENSHPPGHWTERPPPSLLWLRHARCTRTFPTSVSGEPHRRKWRFPVLFVHAWKRSRNIWSQAEVAQSQVLIRLFPAEGAREGRRGPETRREEALRACGRCGR